MLPFLAVFSASRTYVGIDIGCEFFKIAKSTNGGEATIFRNPISSEVSTPSAIALKLARPMTPPFSSRDFEDISIRTGHQALSILRSNSSLGYEYVPRAIARARTSEFHTSTIANDTELFSLLLYRAVTLALPCDGVSIAVPSYWTRQQITVIGDACRMFNIPLVAVVFDVNAVFAWYCAVRLNRFIHAPRHVMFIDVGASSTKVYSGKFNYDKSDPKRDFAAVTQTSYEWSEQIGGYWFAKSVASAKNVSVHKAQKMLLKGSNFDEILDPFADLLERLITSALVQSGAVDEVQVIGGASTYRFVVEAIKQATNQTIRRDFNANEAIALGTVAATITEEAISPYIEEVIDQLAFLSMNVTCGSQTKVYCRKGGHCEDTIEFNNVSDGCDGVQLIADPTTIPEGCDPLLASYRPTNKANLTGNVTVRIKMRTPDQIMDAVQWCDGGGDCEQSTLDVMPEGIEDVNRALHFVTSFLGAASVVQLRVEVRGAIERLVRVLEKIEGGTVDALREATNEMKEKVDKYKHVLETDGLETYGTAELEEAKKELDEIAKGLRLDLPNANKDDL